MKKYILSLLLPGQKKPFKKGWNSETKFLHSLKEPSTDFQRSYNQFLCQQFLGSKCYYVALNVFSAFALFPYLIFCLLRPKSRGSNCTTHNSAVFTCPEIGMSIIPKELQDEFRSIENVNFLGSANLELKDVKFIVDLMSRFPSELYFVLKSIAKVAIYRSIIQQFKPDAFIVTSEYSFTSSILTKFCEKNEVEHINVMHGEKVFHIRDSFFRFNRCYVYDTHYAKLFNQLRANKNVFLIAAPPSLSINMAGYKKQSYDFTYYLAVFDEPELLKILDNIKKLISLGYSVKIRPHPRYSNLRLLQKHVEATFIEDFKKVNIEESLINTTCAISVYSTVLYQAYMNNIKVVFDDVVYNDFLVELRLRQYFLFSKSHFYLSDILHAKGAVKIN